MTNQEAPKPKELMTKRANEEVFPLSIGIEIIRNLVDSDPLVSIFSNKFLR